MKSEDVHRLIKSLESKRIDDGAALAALNDIRKHAMATKTGVQYLVKHSCVPSLLKLLYRHVSCEREGSEGGKEASENGVSVAVSVVSNLLMERGARQQVKRDGIETLGTILAEFSAEEIRIRCCRALGNLAMDAAARSFIAHARVAPSLVKLLEVRYVDSEERESLESDTAAEKTRTPSESSKSSGEAAQDTLETVFPSLPLVQAACRAIRVTERMSSEVVRAGVMKKIIEMVNSDDDMLSHQAFTVLLPLTQHPHAAALIGASEGVPFFLDLLVSPRWQHSQKEVISGLCQLAKEAVNRVKIREGGGLKVFLKTLRDDNLDGVHDRVMSALVSFLYDDTSLDVMLEDGLVDVLLTHLQDCGGYTSETPVNFCQDAKELLEISASGAATVGDESPSAASEPGSSVATLVLKESASGSCLELLSSTDKSCLSGSTSQVKSIQMITEYDAGSEQILSKVKCVGVEERTESSPVLLTVGGGCQNEEPDTSLSAVCDEVNTDDDKDNAGGALDSDIGTTMHKSSSGDHVYSMNSPTYEAETTWHMEDYHPGITCKSYHRANLYMSPTAGSSCSDDSGSSMSSPYSPLSADSYYSPSHASRSSPAYSSAASSPAYSYTTLSPSRSSCESQRSTPVYSGPLSPGGASADILSPLSPPQLGSPAWSIKSSPAYTTIAAAHALVFSSSEEDSCDVDDAKYFSSSSEMPSKLETAAPSRESAVSELSKLDDLHPGGEDLKPAPNVVESHKQETCTNIHHEALISSLGFETDHSQPFFQKGSQDSHGGASASPLSTRGPNMAATREAEEVTCTTHSSDHKKYPQTSRKGPSSHSEAQRFKPASVESVNEVKHENSIIEAEVVTTLLVPVVALDKHRGHNLKGSSSPKPSAVSCDKLPSESEHPSLGHSTSSDHLVSESATDRKSGDSLGSKHAGVKRFLTANVEGEEENDSDGDKTHAAKRRRTVKPPSQYAAVTQNNLLILLSRLSVRDDLNKQLASSKVVYCLLDHLALAREPQDRCVRILSRIMSSPHCLHSLLTMCVPAVIVRSLLLDPTSGIKLQAIHANHSKRTSHFVTHGVHIASRSQLYRYHSMKEGIGSQLECAEMRRSFSTEARASLSSVSSIKRCKDELVLSQARSTAAHHHQLAEGKSCHQASSKKLDQVQDKPVLDLCRTGVRLLDDVSNQVMLPYGEGVVSHVLHRHAAPNQLVFATSLLFLLPYWNRGRRQKILFSRGTLEKLLSVLCTPLATSHTIKEAVVTGLAFLLHHLQPPFHFEPQDMQVLLHKAVVALSPDSLTQPTEIELSVGANCCRYATAKKDLHLQAGSNKSWQKLGANRDVLMRKSPMFSAMLQGSYIESMQSEVTIEDTTPEALKFILHYLHGCDEQCRVLQLGSTDTSGDHAGSQSPSESQEGKKLSEPQDADSTFLGTGMSAGISRHSDQDMLQQCLNTITLADRFLLPELARYLSSVVSCSLLGKATAAEVFRFAVFHGLTDLAEDSMQVLLLSPQPLLDTASQVIDLAQSEAGSEVTASITALVRRGVAMAD
ncbi:hypothetical protein BaRGS_00002730 [Batillaria attramentaria]|uniref:BTB domain-containing protein n=1 Tax=Batillaria attramentaria TaxID=370345 RepID=A0ABD0M3R5_9CAEN